MMKYWPLAAGIFALAGTWTTFALQLNGIIETDKYRLQQINELEQAKIDQAVTNSIMMTQHAEIDKYLRLLDSKYDKQCK